MTESDGNDMKQWWSLRAAMALLLSIAAALAALFWEVLWRSPFHRFAGPRSIMVLAAAAFTAAAVATYTLSTSKRRGVWMAWVAMLLAFMAMVRSLTVAHQRIETPADAQPYEPNIAAVVDTPVAAEVDGSADTAPPVEPGEPNLAPIVEGDEPITRLAEGRFAGFAGLVGDLRAGLYDAVYEYFSEDLRRQWPRERFVEDLAAFREEIGPRWHVRPGGIAGACDDASGRALCVVALTDSNDYQLFAELSPSGEAFAIERLTPMRLRLADTALAEKIYLRAAEFVNALLSGNYIIARLLIEPHSGPKPSAESLARLRNALRGGTWTTPSVVYAPPGWSIEMGRRQYTLDAITRPPGVGGLQITLWEALPGELAIDSFRYFAAPDANTPPQSPGGDPNE